MNTGAFEVAQLGFAFGLLVATVGIVITGVYEIKESKKLRAAYTDQIATLSKLTTGINAATDYFRTEQEKKIRNRQRQVIDEVRNNDVIFKQWQHPPRGDDTVMPLPRTERKYCRDAWDTFCDDALFARTEMQELQNYYRYVFDDSTLQQAAKTVIRIDHGASFHQSVQDAGLNLNGLIARLEAQVTAGP